MYTEFDLWSSTLIVLTDWHTSSFRFVADCSKIPSSYLNGHFYKLARSFFPLYQPQVSFPSFVLFSGTYNKTTSSRGHHVYVILSTVRSDSI